MRLVPPWQLNATYPYERGHLLYRRARVNITHPDYVQHPQARRLTPVTVRLHPGDFLIFPAYVPHQPEAVTDSISISFRMKPVRAGGAKGDAKAGEPSRGGVPGTVLHTDADPRTQATASS